METIGHPLSGVYVAAITPFTLDGNIDFDIVPDLMNFYEDQGAHGVLLAGTTGEGTSLSDAERLSLIEAALKIKEERPEFKILAATGTPSLSQSIHLSSSATEMGCDGIVVLPPYFYRNVGEEGLFNWYAQLIEKALPSGGNLLAYHIPQITQVAMPISLLSRLGEKFPGIFAGMKDSTGDIEHAISAIEALPGKAVMVGNDHLISASLTSGSGGAITALGNLRIAASRQIWDRFHEGKETDELQDNLSKSRNVLDQFPSAPAFLKALFAKVSDFPAWKVRAPLLDFTEAQAEKVYSLYMESQND